VSGVGYLVVVVGTVEVWLKEGTVGDVEGMGDEWLQYDLEDASEVEDASDAPTQLASAVSTALVSFVSTELVSRELVCFASTELVSKVDTWIVSRRDMWIPWVVPLLWMLLEVWPMAVSLFGLDCQLFVVVVS
jgi:hypothetical protein